MKLTYTRLVSRRILLAFLSFVIILSIAALFVRNSISKKLENISKLSNNIESDQSQPERVLILLHEADNDFQQSLLSTNKKNNVAYKVKLNEAFSEINTLLKKDADTASLTSFQKIEIKKWYNKKLALSDRLYILRHNFDSLLTVYADLNTLTTGNTHLISVNTHSEKSDVKANSDTIKKVAPKQGLIKRLKNAFTNKAVDLGGTTEIRHNKSTKETDATTKKIVTENTTAYNKKLQQLQQQNVKLLNIQRQLSSLNTNIINALEGIINNIKDINYNMADEFKSTALKSYQESTALLNKLYLAALFFVLMFAVLLIIFIVQLNQSELHLRKEVQRSVTIAQQKMDLLHHMSHEIRNPLTAIRGFLYILSKSNMSPKQIDMLESITLSSDMMIRTLTDTLDAAKMESSELTINTEPFNPHFVLNMIVKTMESSATRKNLNLTCNFNGNKEAMVLGDSFRLKQVMVNLLSNAIKYTNAGDITVNAQLSAVNSRLQVDIIDTGVGITQEQQSNLFSKYYQTDSSKGKVGTGLGLFICKQLIELQDGKISVKSNQGAGTTFTFFIPYQKSEDIPKIDANDPVSILKGKSILAVDDNKLNLLFLQKILQKWDVLFYKATNGEEALDMILKNEIAVVLTDLQMPVMDGRTLLSEINKLDKPNQIPVIVISGASEITDREKNLEMGFAAMVSKPFEEAELIKELVSVLVHNKQTI